MSTKRRRDRRIPCPCSSCNGDLRDRRTRKSHVYKEQQAQQVLQDIGEVAVPELEREEEKNEEVPAYMFEKVCIV